MKSLRELLALAHALVRGAYAPGRLSGPTEFSRDAAILIQWSDIDGAWLATVRKAPLPVQLGLVNADGPTPAAALAALDDVLTILADRAVS